MNQLEVIQGKIHEIRGQRVMLDFDLAEMYGIETAQLKRAVRRNIDRFEGDDFMFEVTREELSRCQIGTLNKGRGHNFKYLPFAFTELGVAMLSSVLNSKIAIDINRGIMRAFVALRQMLAMPKQDMATQLQREIKKLRDDMEEMFADQNDINEETRAQLDAISMALAELQAKNKELPPRRKIGFRIENDDEKQG